jgi:hypothetical protein
MGNYFAEAMNHLRERYGRGIALAMNNGRPDEALVKAVKKILAEAPDLSLDLVALTVLGNDSALKAASESAADFLVRVRQAMSSLQGEERGKNGEHEPMEHEEHESKEQEHKEHHRPVEAESKPAEMSLSLAAAERRGPMSRERMRQVANEWTGNSPQLRGIRLAMDTVPDPPTTAANEFASVIESQAQERLKPRASFPPLEMPDSERRTLQDLVDRALRISKVLPWKTGIRTKLSRELICASRYLQDSRQRPAFDFLAQFAGLVAMAESMVGSNGATPPRGA